MFVSGNRKINRARSIAAAGVSLSVLAGLAVPVMAQDSDGLVLEEIVVTARKRAEKLQEVPLAITAVDAQTLEKAGVENLRDLLYLTPGVTLYSTGAEWGAQPVVRGQTNLNGGFGDPNVSTFVNGVYLPNPTAINLAIADISRVEVVKGPVSALYGRNSYGGAINYVTRDPGNELEARIKGTIGNDGMKSLVGAIRGPLIEDKLSLGLAAGIDKFDGSYKDGVSGARAGGRDKKDGQISLAAYPTEALTVKGSFYYGRDKFDASPNAYFENNCATMNGGVANAVTPIPFSQYCGLAEVNEANIQIPAAKNGAGVSGNDRTVRAGDLRIGYDFDFAQLDLTTGYSKIDARRFNNFTGRRNGLPFALVNSATGAATGQTINLQHFFGNDANNKNFSQEARISSPQDQDFRWAFGGFYFDSTSYATTKSGIDGSTIPAGFTVNPVLARSFITVDGRFPPNVFTESEAEATQKSGFVGVDYDVTDQVTLQGELRRVNDKRYQLTFMTNGSRLPPAGVPYNKTFNYTDYRASAKYQATEAVMLYASLATGTKAGGFNSGATLVAESAFDPETNTTYEAGFKSTLFDNRLLLNGSFFFIKAKDLQITGPSDDPANAALLVKNYGRVDTKGLELDANLRIAQGAKVNVGLGYSDPRFQGGTYDFSSAASCALIASCASRLVDVPTARGPRRAVDLAGLMTPRTSKLQLTAGFDLDGPINDAWSWIAHGDYRFESRQYIANNNYSWFGDRNLVNLRIGAETENYSVALFVDNLLDDLTPEGGAPNTRFNDLTTNVVATLPQGQTWGVSLSYKY